MPSGGRQLWRIQQHVNISPTINMRLNWKLHAMHEHKKMKIILAVVSTRIQECSFACEVSTYALTRRKQQIQTTCINN